MDNFKRYDRGKKPNASLDGMLPGGATPKLEIPENPDKKPEGLNKIGQDGFNAGAQPKLEIQGDNLIGRNLAPHGGGLKLGISGSKNKKDKDKKPKTKLRKVLKRGSLILGVLVLVCGAYFGVKLYLASRNVLHGGGGAPALAADVDASKLNGEGDGRINILLIGKGGENHPGGNLTDTILLASIDPIQKELALLSIPRDFYVKIPTVGYQKINSAYNYGYEASSAKDKAGKQADGVKMLYDTLSPVLGIPIHYYSMFDFTAYKDLVNTVGGIDITLDNAIYDPNFDWEYGRNALKLPAGKVHLNGTQALLLGRSRGAAGGYGVTSDFDRNENQRKMLIALKDKILSAGTYSNPSKINGLINAFGSHVQTSFSLGEIKRLYEIMQTIPSNNNVVSLDFVTPPDVLIQTGNAGGLSVVLPVAGMGNYKDIQNFVRNKIKDSFLRSENASVAIYNATNVPGLAATQAEILKSFGYNVTVVADAPTKSNGQKTVVVDQTKGVKKYTKRYLEQRFKTTAVGSIPDSKIQPGAVDFVIILGTDATTTP